MGDKVKLQEQREIWLRAVAAVDEAERRAAESAERHAREVERARSRVRVERATLENMAKAHQDEIDSFLANVTEEERKVAAGQIGEPSAQGQPDEKEGADVGIACDHGPESFDSLESVWRCDKCGEATEVAALPPKTAIFADPK